MSDSVPRRRLAILTNVLAPYRVPVFQRLAQQFDVTVLCSGEESNRGQWRQLAEQAYNFRVKRAAGLTFTWTKQINGGVQDTRYLHLNPGFFTELLRLRPDAIITNEMGFRSLMALVYGGLFRCPVWVWWGGTLHTERGIGRLKRTFRRHFISLVRRWFSYGLTSTEYLVSLGVDRGTVVELQNSVSEASYHRLATPTFEVEPRPVLLYVGRLIAGKGVDLFLRAAAHVRETTPPFSILLVGDGPERQALEQTAVELRLPNVQFQPARPPGDMAGVYRSGDVLVFPTLDDVWGLVVNEALWSGLPALVSVYAGCAKELVPPESTFDPLESADFAAKLRLAIAGELPPPDVHRLKRIADVSDMIIQELNAALGDR